MDKTTHMGARNRRSNNRSSHRSRLTEVEVENKIVNLGVVFGLLENKDIFKKFYAKLLAKRLISASSASEDSEQFMLLKLREICGLEFVSKLQRMFADKDSSHVRLFCYFGKKLECFCRL